jgi:ribosomal protein L40E
MATAAPAIELPEGSNELGYAAGAAGVCIVAAVGVDYLLRSVAVPSGITEAVASVCLAAHPIVHRTLETRKLSLSTDLVPAKSRHQVAVTFQRYELPASLVLISSTLFIAGLMQFLGVLAVLGARIFGAGGAGALNAAAGPNTLIRMYVALMVGRWIGTRCRSTPYRVAIFALLGAQILGDCIDVISLTPADYLAIYNTTETPVTIALLIAGSTGMALFLAGVACGGCWWGKRSKVPSYVAYLVRQLPGDRQSELVRWTHAEVERVHVQPRPRQEPATGTEPQPVQQQADPVSEAGTVASGTVTCPRCGSHTAGGAHFCGECGTQIPMVERLFCGECGAALSPDAKFCRACGHATRVQQTGSSPAAP